MKKIEYKQTLLRLKRKDEEDQQDKLNQEKKRIMSERYFIMLSSLSV
jgi:hypothetical protein